MEGIAYRNGTRARVCGFHAMLIDPASHRMDREERSREDRRGKRKGRGCISLDSIYHVSTQAAPPTPPPSLPPS